MAHDARDWSWFRHSIDSTANPSFCYAQNNGKKCFESTRHIYSQRHISCTLKQRLPNKTMDQIPEGMLHSGKIYAGYADVTFFDEPDRYSRKQ